MARLFSPRWSGFYGKGSGEEGYEPNERQNGDLSLDFSNRLLEKGIRKNSEDKT